MNHIYQPNPKDTTEKCKTCGCIREPKTVDGYSGYVYTRDRILFNGEPACIDWDKQREEDYRFEDEDIAGCVEEVEFDCCFHCDLPDVCSDFNECAIKVGRRKPPIGYNGIF